MDECINPDCPGKKKAAAPVKPWSHPDAVPVRDGRPINFYERHPPCATELIKCLKYGNTNQLFGVTSKEDLLNVSIKAKSKGASADGYEMNFLVDNVDVVNNGDTPVPPTPPTPGERGDTFNLDENYIKDFYICWLLSYDL